MALAAALGRSTELASRHESISIIRHLRITDPPLNGGFCVCWQSYASPDFIRVLTTYFPSRRAERPFPVNCGAVYKRTMLC
jgi:hypothetical protein